MAYSRRIPVKKLNLTSFNQFFETLLHIFEQLSKQCMRIDIVFDLYLNNSVKGYERLRRSKVDSIETLILRYDQQLPVDIDRFWSSNKNKTNLQKAFIKWMINNYNSHKSVYLGGSHDEELAMCLHLQNGNAYIVPALNYGHEEADNRIIYHINHAVKVERFSRIIVASGDTDVFICLLYHFSNWKKANLKELWVLCGQGNTTRAVPLHNKNDCLDLSVINILPAIHALTGCDTTSKIGTKKSALLNAERFSEQLQSFDKIPIDDKMISSAEIFLVNCVTSKHNEVTTFNKLRSNNTTKNI